MELFLAFPVWYFLEATLMETLCFPTLYMEASKVILPPALVVLVSVLPPFILILSLTPFTAFLVTLLITFIL